MIWECVVAFDPLSHGGKSPALGSEKADCEGQKENQTPPPHSHPWNDSLGMWNLLSRSVNYRKEKPNRAQAKKARSLIQQCGTYNPVFSLSVGYIGAMLFIYKSKSKDVCFGKELVIMHS